MSQIQLMKEGKIILTPIPQSDGKTKLRPVLILKVLPGYNDYYVCGISSNLNHEIAGFDEKIISSDNDYKQSGLLKDSLIRLAFLATLPSHLIAGAIGNISDERHHKLLQNLADYLLSKK